MFLRISLLLVATFILSVLADNETFKNVKLRYHTTDNDDASTVEIKSTNNLKSAFEASKITRIKILEGSTLPIIYQDAFSDLPVLTGLELSHLEIEEIHPGALKNVPRLERLRCSRNKLKLIEAGVFSNLINLEFLELENNLIENVSPQAFDNLPKLKVLELSNNKIKKFHAEWLRGKPSLESVSLIYNQIEHLPSGVFANFHNDAHLNNNRIKSVSRDIFGSDGKVVFGQLWLANNEIEQWDESFIKGAEFRALDMSGNKLQCLEGDYGNFFVALQSRIDGNPWNCECLLPIAKWAVQHQDERGVDMTESAQKCNSTGQFPTLLI